MKHKLVRMIGLITAKLAALYRDCDGLSFPTRRKPKSERAEKVSAN
jgi:hypothetical protein